MHQAGQEGEDFDTLALINQSFSGPTGAAIVVVEVQTTAIGQNLLKVPTDRAKGGAKFNARGLQLVTGSNKVAEGPFGVGLV